MQKKIGLDKSDAANLRAYFNAFNNAQNELAVAATVILSRMGIDPATARVDGMDGDTVIVQVPDAPAKPPRKGSEVIPPKGGRR